MALVKIYKYKIKPNKQLRYLEIQERTQSIYRQHGEIEFNYLKDAVNPLIRTEVIHFYDSEPTDVIQKIDSDSRIKKLFKEFSDEILDPSYPICEETLVDEKVSATSKVHHIEIYCSNLEKSSQFWNWFLNELGYKQYQKWEQGISFKLGHTYLVFVQAETKHLDTKYHRCKPGLNHLAFYASSSNHVDQLTQKLRDRGVTILYENKHPHAGGDNYGVYFEDPERIKVEVMAP
ncbi:MAG: VOC family protein [Pseudobdellovibrionaceae bacterium]